MYYIGKHASEFGTASTLRKFKVEFPQLRESTVCSIRSKYDEELKVALKQKREPKSALPFGQRGRRQCWERLIKWCKIIYKYVMFPLTD